MPPKTKGLKGKVDEDAENESGTDVTEFEDHWQVNLLHSMQKDLDIVKQENKLRNQRTVDQSAGVH